MEWIDVNKELPKEYENILLFCKGGDQQDSFIGYMCCNKRFRSFELEYLEPRDSVTHWMPLPEPPTKH